MRRRQRLLQRRQAGLAKATCLILWLWGGAAGSSGARALLRETTSRGERLPNAARRRHVALHSKLPRQSPVASAGQNCYVSLCRRAAAQLMCGPGQAQQGAGAVWLQRFQPAQQKRHGTHVIELCVLSWFPCGFGLWCGPGDRTPNHIGMTGRRAARKPHLPISQPPPLYLVEPSANTHLYRGCRISAAHATPAALLSGTAARRRVQRRVS